MRKERSIFLSSSGFRGWKKKPQRFPLQQATLRDENILAHTQFALVRQPLGSVSQDLRRGANRSPLQEYSSTKAKMSVLYFFAIFVMFFPKDTGTVVEVKL
jgi:hypothetical protein